MDTLPPPSPLAPSNDPITNTDSVIEREAHAVADLAARLIGTMDAVIAGKHEVVEVSVATLLCGGHLLIEDVPGVGKTLLAQVLARSVGGTFHRIQGTSDLLPGDITGSMVPGGQLDVDGMRFRPGPVFANIVVFDELNRATPRTQSALLELAEESTVTVDGVSHRAPGPVHAGRHPEPDRQSPAPTGWAMERSTDSTPWSPPGERRPPPRSRCSPAGAADRCSMPWSRW